MLNKILIGFIVLSILFVAGFYAFVNSGVELPPETDKVIEEVLASDNLPELILGETGLAESQGINIWYERLSTVDTPKATLLLVMGHSATALLWTPSFYQSFLDSGYQVIRYDNRGVGESDWMEDWDENNPYTLEDMAKDGIAVLDAVGVEKTHVIGASMGGMIGQRLAISHSDRVLSLTSIMSSGFMNDPEIDRIPDETMQNFLKLTLKHLLFNVSESDIIKFSIGIQKGLKGNGPYESNISEIANRTLYELRNRKGFNPSVGDQHTAAINASGSRFEELGSITAPTLVIHGKSDPLVIFQHAEKYTPMIPGTQALFIEGMGHDIPDLYMEQVHYAIFQNMKR